ncbi:MAG: multiheme c-type cytochrome [Planctomycetaceae bacterium]
MALGAGGCATASCHGGPAAGNRDVQSFAATLWAERDPHARASATLHDPRSRKMAALLGIGEAHRAEQCLACHSTQASCGSPLPPAALADGVACGSCHGDATRWVTVHTLPEWKQLDDVARAELGYRDLADPRSRVRTCIPCHVGDASREVNHDMIAAGHPRLAFEFAAYQRLWPRHWSPQGRAEAAADFAERSWAVGQAETLAAVARLLEVRARRAADADAAVAPDAVASHAGGYWPEFAEFDCYACHRALSPERVAGAAAGPFANPAPGTPTWQPWSVAAARLLAAAVDDPAVAAVEPAATELRAAFDPAWAVAGRDRLERTRALARALEVAADDASRALAARGRIVLEASPDRLDAAVAADRPGWRTWDAAAQTYLLIDAALDGGPARLGLWHTSPPPTDTRAALDHLRAGLRFPPGAGGPDGFDPARFQRDRAGIR